MRARLTLETPRLVLEPLGLRHAEALWSAIERSLPELRVWMAWAVEPNKENSVGLLRASRRRG